MKQGTNAARRQLALSLEREQTNLLPEETHQALITALADLLLEALGEATHQPASDQGDHDESENHL